MAAMPGDAGGYGAPTRWQLPGSCAACACLLPARVRCGVLPTRLHIPIPAPQTGEQQPPAAPDTLLLLPLTRLPLMLLLPLTRLRSTPSSSNTRQYWLRTTWAAGRGQGREQGSVGTAAQVPAWTCRRPQQAI